MTGLFAIALLVTATWSAGEVPVWAIILSVLLALLDLGGRLTQARLRKPYVSWEDADGDVSPLHWMSDALIDLSADLRNVLNEIEFDAEEENRP